MAKIVIYTTEICPYCVRAKKLLDQKGVSYTEIRVDLNSAARDEMIALTGRKTVPQIVIDDEAIGGCDDLYALERAGQLDKRLY